jgi:hypothetical protein
VSRHVDPDHGPFYRSVAVAVGRGLLAVAVVAAIVALLSFVGRAS